MNALAQQIIEQQQAANRIEPGSIIGKRPSQTDEAQSGECWTCDRAFLDPRSLVIHVRTEHNRDPR